MLGSDYSAPVGGVHSQRDSGHCEEGGGGCPCNGAGLRVGWAVGVGKLFQTEELAQAEVGEGRLRVRGQQPIWVAPS